MTIKCPLIACGAENTGPVTACTQCGADLRAYAVALRLPDLCFNRALRLAGAGDFAGAENELHACLKFRPDDAEARLLLGRVHWAANDRHKAREIWTQLQATATDPRLREQLAACLDATRSDRTARKREHRHKKGRRP